jgi:hypothetical protein
VSGNCERAAQCNNNNSIDSSEVGSEPSQIKRERARSVKTFELLMQEVMNYVEVEERGCESMQMKSVNIALKECFHTETPGSKTHILSCTFKQYEDIKS